MASHWAAVVGLGTSKPRSESNEQEARNLQDGLWQIGSQAWHILVHANNNNISTFEDDEDKSSDYIRSLVEVAATSDRASNQDQQLAMLIPHTASRIAPTKASKSSKLNVSILLLSWLLGRRLASG